MNLSGSTLLAAFAFLLAAGTGCATSSSREAGPHLAEPGAPVQLLIENQAFLDATIRADRSGARERLGLVVGKSEGTFTLDWRPGDVLTLEADLIAGGACRTESILLEPGETYSFELRSFRNNEIECLRTAHRR